MAPRAIETESGLDPEVLEGCKNICWNDNNVFEKFVKVPILKMFRYF
jgi:hypothetical protein